VGRVWSVRCCVEGQFAFSRACLLPGSGCCCVCCSLKPGQPRPQTTLRPNQQGRTLLQLVRAFYTDPAAHRLVYKFNHEPKNFHFEDLLAELGHTSPAGSSPNADAK